MDEEVSTNLIVTADWDLADIVHLGTTVGLVILERRAVGSGILELL